MELSSLKQETQTSLWASKEGNYMPSIDRSSVTRYDEEFTEGVTETGWSCTPLTMVMMKKGPGAASQAGSAMAPCGGR